MRRREVVFLAVFLALLGGGFALLAYQPVNDRVVEPFTGLVARASGGALRLLGQPVQMEGTVIRGPSFAVNIRNGCNGIETLVIFWSAVLAFPAPWRSRLLGLLVGSAAIQAVNLVRVVALYLTGAYAPAWFDRSHTVVWQTIVILCGVLLWVFWATRLVPARAPGEPR